MDLSRSVEFIPPDEAKKEFFANYENELVALANFAAKTICQKKAEHVLVFGMPGGGKSLIGRRVQYELNTQKKLRTSLLVLKCNECAGLSDFELEHVTNELFRIQTLLQRWQTSGIILCLDELDCIAPDRLRQIGDKRYVSLSQKLMGYLSNDFGGCKGLVTLLITNYPILLEKALLDRANSSVYFPPISKRPDAAVEILRSYNLKEPEKVHEELEKLLGTSFYTGRGLLQSCARAQRSFASLDLPSITKLIFRYLPPPVGNKQDMDDYERKHETLIRHADQFVELERTGRIL